MRRRWLAGSAKRQSRPVSRPGNARRNRSGMRRGRRRLVAMAASCLRRPAVPAEEEQPAPPPRRAARRLREVEVALRRLAEAVVLQLRALVRASPVQRRALCRRRSNGVERRLARWRYFGGIALETFERVLGARLHAGALRHEVGAAGGADRRNLLGRRLLGRGRQRSPNHEPGRNQQAHSAPTAELHASLPFCRAAHCTIGRVPSSMRCIAVARRLCDCGLVC